MMLREYKKPKNFKVICKLAFRTITFPKYILTIYYLDNMRILHNDSLIIFEYLLTLFQHIL